MILNVVANLAVSVIGVERRSPIVDQICVVGYRFGDDAAVVAEVRFGDREPIGLTGVVRCGTA